MRKQGSERAAVPPRWRMPLRCARVTCEYAKCKNGLWRFQPPAAISAMRIWTSRALRSCARDRAMNDQPSHRKPLPPAAQRALAEAEQRRQAAAAQAKAAPKELQGPKGPEPTRFGDWERKGIASDF